MKLAAITVAVLLAAAPVAAADLGNTGISISAELDNRYNVDQEAFTMTMSPEIGYNLSGFHLSLGTDIVILENDTIVLGDTRPTIDFGAKYGLTAWGLSSEAYFETGYNLELNNMSDIEIGVKFSF